MAKKKNRGRKTSRRMSGVRGNFKNTLKKNEDTLILAGGVLLGAIGKGFIDKTLAEQETLKLEQKTIDGIQVAAGVAGMLFLEGPFLKGVSIGLASSAGTSVLRTMKVIKGAEMPMVRFRLPVRYRNNMNGASVNPTVGSPNVYGFPQAPGVGRVPRRKAAGAY